MYTFNIYIYIYIYSKNGCLCTAVQTVSGWEKVSRYSYIYIGEWGKKERVRFLVYVRESLLVKDA